MTQILGANVKDMLGRLKIPDLISAIRDERADFRPICHSANERKEEHCETACSAASTFCPSELERFI